MKKSVCFLLILLSGLMMVSCNKNRSYTDMLNKEKKAIRLFIDENDIEVLKTFPPDSVFKENQFVRLDTDIYLQIVDKGNGNKPVAGSTRILCRFSADRISIDEEKPAYLKKVSNYGPNSNGTYPIVYKYGYATVEESKASGSAIQYYLEELMSEGLATGLDYVSENGKVRLLVPFKRGSQNDNNNGYPVYFEIVEYKFE